MAFRKIKGWRIEELDLRTFVWHKASKSFDTAKQARIEAVRLCSACLVKTLRVVNDYEIHHWQMTFVRGGSNRWYRKVLH